MKRTAALGTCLMLLCLGCTQGEKRITLRLKFQPGSIVAYEQTAKRNFQLSEHDSLLTRTSSTFHTSLEYAVQEVFDDGSAEIIERSTVRLEVPDRNAASRKDSILQRHDTRLRIEPTGKVTRLDAADGDDENTWLMKHYAQAAPVFPSGEISPGYSWTHTNRVVLPDEVVEATTRYRLTAFAREIGYDCAIIEYEGDLTLPYEASPLDSSGRSGTDRIQTVGVVYFAYTEGLPVLQRERWILNGDRVEIRDGRTIRRRVLAETDVEMVLAERRVAEAVAGK